MLHALALRRFASRFAIALLVLFSAHYYVWLRFVDAAALPSPWHGLATAAIALLAPSLLVAAIATRMLPRATARPIAWVAYTWFGLAVYLLCTAALSHLACALGLLGARPAALVGVAVAVGTVLAALVHVARGPQVRRVRVPIDRLPAAADGYTIVQLTDVHIGPLLGASFAAELVARVNKLAPDLIVITGDLVDGRLDELREHIEPLRGLAARDGVFAVTGNHEYYWDLQAWLQHLRSLGMRLLRNQHVTLRDAFVLAGVDDATAGEDVPRALAGRDPALPVVLLAHHPQTIARAARAGVALQLSGHTHGGQLLPLGWLARLFEPQVAGLGRFGTTWLYVSEGTGFWGPPLRVGTTAEITHVTLVRA